MVKRTVDYPITTLGHLHVSATLQLSSTSTEDIDQEKMAEESVGLVEEEIVSTKEGTRGWAAQATESDSREVTTPQCEENIQLPAMKDGIEVNTNSLVFPGRIEIPNSEGFSEFQFPSSLPRAAEIFPWTTVNGVVQPSQLHIPETAHNVPTSEDAIITEAAANAVQAESDHASMDTNDGREQEPSSSLLALVVAAVGGLRDTGGMMSEIDQAELYPVPSATQDIASSTEQLIAAPGAHFSDMQMILAINEETGVTGTNPELGILPGSNTTFPDVHANHDVESGEEVKTSPKEQVSVEAHPASLHREIRSQDSDELGIHIQMSPLSEAAQDRPGGEQSIEVTVFTGAEEVPFNGSDDEETPPMAESNRRLSQIDEKDNLAEGHSMDLDDFTSIGATQTERLPTEDEQSQVQMSRVSTAIFKESIVEDGPFPEHTVRSGSPEQAIVCPDTQSIDRGNLEATIAPDASPSVQFDTQITSLPSPVLVDLLSMQPLSSAEIAADLSDLINTVPKKCEQTLESQASSDNLLEKIATGSQAAIQGEDNPISPETIHTTNDFSSASGDSRSMEERKLRASALQEISIITSNSSNIKPTETVGSLVVRDSEEIPSSSQETAEMPMLDTMDGQYPVTNAPVLENDISREHESTESVDEHARRDEQQRAIRNLAAHNKSEDISDTSGPEPKNTSNLKTTISNTDSDSTRSQNLSVSKDEAYTNLSPPGKKGLFRQDGPVDKQTNEKNTETKDGDEVMHGAFDAKLGPAAHRNSKAVASINNLSHQAIPEVMEVASKASDVPTRTKSPGSSDSVNNDVVMGEPQDGRQHHFLAQDKLTANDRQDVLVTTTEESQEPSSKRKRVIPDSEDDEGGLEESPLRPSMQQESPEVALSPADHSQIITTISLSTEAKHTPIPETPFSSSKIEGVLPPTKKNRPKTPNTSFKLPTLSKDKDKDDSRPLRSSPSPSPSPSTSTTQHQDPVMAELKAIKIASLKSKNAALRLEIENKRKKLEEAEEGLTQPAAETVRMHIKLLHEYNDIRDVGQGLIGMIADNRGVRIGDLYEEFGVDLRD